MEINNVTSIILAGGKSTRMGQNKALMKLNGLPLIQHVYNSLTPISSTILISSNSAEYSFLNTEIVEDKYPGVGPIGGIYSCLKKSNTILNIVVSCDTPFLSPDFFIYLLTFSKGFDITIPIHKGITEPIIGIYKKHTYTTFEHFINAGIYSPSKAIKSLKHNYVEISKKQPFYNPNLFANLNSLEDLNRL
ncbi:MAG: molybdenum cofactor guanylyltransferase [Chlorobi bacterium]|nr:molybdenum cofactor guanylyltransferase [Chlorobiota bacterium]